MARLLDNLWAAVILDGRVVEITARPKLENGGRRRKMGAREDLEVYLIRSKEKSLLELMEEEWF